MINSHLIKGVKPLKMNGNMGTEAKKKKKKKNSRVQELRRPLKFALTTGLNMKPEVEASSALCWS